MTDRVCVLHIGTHKTGTTLLQHFLQWNAESLRSAGLFFPSAGWYGVVPGQHAVAWELFDQGAQMQTAALFQQLCDNKAPHAIVSSEEFSLLSYRPAALHELIELVQRAGYSVKVLAYVRPQPGFVESMFAEGIKHHEIRSFSTFLEEVLETGSMPAHGRRVPVRASELLVPFSEFLGDRNIYLRAYPIPGNDLAIFHDFLATLAELVPRFSPGQLQLNLHRTRMNDSLTFGHLLGTAFLSLFPDAGLPEDPEVFIAEHVPGLPIHLFDTRFSLLERRDYLRFLEVFGEDNRRVRDRYGMSAPFLTEHDIPNPDDPRFAVAAFERPLLDARVATWLERSRATAIGNNA